MMRNYEHVRIHDADSILYVEIHRPERLNALHAPANFELSDVFDAFEADASLRVAIIAGTGTRAFCAGNDLKWQAEGGSMARPPTGFGGLTLRTNRTKPVIAAVNGVAMGGGCEMVLAADLAIAADNARFALPEARRGLVPLAGVHLLPRCIGPKAAMGMLLTGHVLDAAQALRIGLLNDVVAEGGALEAATRWAHDIIEGSPQAIATCLDMTRRSLDTPDLAIAMNASYASLDRLRASEDFREGPLAFAERRKPKWAP